MPCSLDKVVAMSMVYRRIAHLIFTGSKAVGVSPLAFWLASKILSFVTDHVALSVVLTVGLTEAARRLLLPYWMPTTPPDKLRDSFRKNIFIIYLFLFLVSSYISFYVGPMLPTNTMKGMPALTLARALKTSVLLAAAALVAGSSVFVRYFAKVGISKWRV
jgi:polyferredoxin